MFMFDLFVDDIRPQPLWWHVARTIEEAKTLLTTGRVNNLSLDHDMGACQACTDAGTPVRRYVGWRYANTRDDVLELVPAPRRRYQAGSLDNRNRALVDAKTDRPQRESSRLGTHARDD
jgi:hypothetical protein